MGEEDDGEGAGRVPGDVEGDGDGAFAAGAVGIAEVYGEEFEGGVEVRGIEAGLALAGRGVGRGVGWGVGWGVVIGGEVA